MAASGYPDQQLLTERRQSRRNTKWLDRIAGPHDELTTTGRAAELNRNGIGVVERGEPRPQG
jgi:hypothetical protein